MPTGEVNSWVQPMISILLPAFQKYCAWALILTVPFMAACSPARSDLAECRYEVEKLLVNYKTELQVERDLKMGELINDCMRAKGFEFNVVRSNANSAKKKYSGYIDSVMDEGNWDRWWWAKLTHEKPK